MRIEDLPKNGYTMGEETHWISFLQYISATQDSPVAQEILSEMERLCTPDKNRPGSTPIIDTARFTIRRSIAQGSMLVALAATKVRLKNLGENPSYDDRLAIVTTTAGWIASITPEPWWWAHLPDRWLLGKRRKRLNGIRTTLTWNHASVYPKTSFPMIPLPD